MQIADLLVSAMYRVLRGFRVSLQIFVVLVVLLTGVFSYTRTGAPAPVQAATSSNLNFQARLLNANGSLVADGNYNLEFKLYNTATPAANPDQGACTTNGGTPDAGCLWVETRTSGTAVRVVNGYFSVNLGDVQAFPNINWDQDLWLTMNVGGVGAPVWDGQMSPPVKLTAVPYAFQAKQSERLFQNQGTYTGTLEFGTLGNENQTYRLPSTALAYNSNGGATICVYNGLVSNCPAATGSAYYIQNAAYLTDPQAEANIWIQATNDGANGTVAAILMGAEDGQTVDLFQLQAPDGTILTSFNAAGELVFGPAGNQDTKLYRSSADVLATQSSFLLDGTGSNLTVEGTGTSSFAGDLEIAGALEVNGETTFDGNVTIANANSFTVGTGEVLFGGTLDVAGLATFNGNLTVSQGQFTNAGSSLFSAISVGDTATNTDIGANTATVDIATTINKTQTTSDRTLTLPNPTDLTAGRIIYINNLPSPTSTESFTMYGVSIAPGSSAAFMWNGTAWVAVSGGTSVNTIGEVDSQTKSADGAFISGSTIYLQYADEDFPGLVSTGTQNFAGDKTFLGAVTVEGLLTGNAGLTIEGGAINLNTAGSDAINIGTADYTGNITIGNNDAGNITLQSSGDISIIGQNFEVQDDGTAILNSAAAQGVFTIQGDGDGTGFASLVLQDGAATSSWRIMNSENNTGELQFIYNGSELGLSIYGPERQLRVGKDGATSGIVLSGTSDNVRLYTNGSGILRVSGAGGTGGTVQAGTAFQAPAFDTISAVTLSIGTANANAITIGKTAVTTTNAGALTVTELLTGNLGATIGGAAISLNDTGAFATTINGNNSTGAVTIGNTAAGTISLQSASGINLGTGGVANTIQIGNTSGAVIQGISIGNNGTVGSTTNLTLGSTVAGTTTIQNASSTAFNFGGTTGALTTNATTLDLFNANATTVNFAQAATTINIGPGSNTASTINFLGGSGASGCSMDGANGTFICSGLVRSTAGFQINTVSNSAGYIAKNVTAATGGVSQYDVVVMNSAGEGATSTTAYDHRVYGVATNAAAGGAAFIAAIGGNHQVTAIGTVVAGDQLVVSGTAGAVMADNNATKGIVGTALSGRSGVGSSQVNLVIRPVNGQDTPDFNGSVAFRQGANYNGTGTVNNANLGEASLVRLTNTGLTLGGIVNGRDGEILTLVNTAAGSATIVNSAAGAADGDKIITGTGANIILQAGGTITLVYDYGGSAATSFWRVVGSAAVNATGNGANFIQGGNAFGADAVLGTTDAYNLIFRTGTGGGANKLQLTQTGDLEFLQASTLKTNTGNLSIDSAAVLNLGVTTATSVEISRTGQATTVNGSLTVDQTSTLTGNVGIGTASSTARLTIGVNTDTTAAGGINFGSDTTLYRSDANALTTDGNLTVGNKLAVGTLAQINGGNTVAPFATFLNIITAEDTFTDLTDVDTAQAIVAYLKVDPTASTNASIYGVDTYVSLEGDNDFNQGYGLSAAIEKQGAGVANYLNGGNLSVTNSGTGNVDVVGGLDVSAYSGGGTSSRIHGIYGSVTLGGNANTAELIGATFAVASNSTGAVTDGYGIQIQSAVNTSGGTFTNNYGLYIQDQSAVGSTNSYNFYSAGATAKNYIQGYLQVGSTSTLGRVNIGTSGDVTAAGGINFGGDTSLYRSNTGQLTVRPTSGNDSTRAFSVRNGADDATILGVDTTNNRVGINLGNSGAPTTTLDLNGAIRIQGISGDTHKASFAVPGAALSTLTTLAGNSLVVDTYTYSASASAIAVGIASNSNATARGILVADARGTDHQQSIGVLSVAGSDILGFSWEGDQNTAASQTTGYLKTLVGNVGIRSGSTDIATFLNNGNTVLSGDLAVNGADITTTSTGTATIFNTNAVTLNIGGAATNAGGGINFAGGSGSTGCSIDGTTGNLTCSGTVSGSTAYLAKNAPDTSSFAVTASNYLYGFTNSSSAVSSGVLSLDNGTNTGNSLRVTTAGNPGLGNAVIFASNTNASPTGNLIDLQSGSVPTSKFAVNAAGLITSIGGAAISGADINLNLNSNFATNINTGTSTGGINIGNNTGNTAISIQSGTSAIDIGTGGQARTISIGTGAALQNVTVGSVNGASILNLQAGTGNANGDINIGDSTVGGKILDIGSVTNSGTSTIRISTTTGSAQTIQIGGTGASGSTSNASTTVALQSGATAFNMTNTGATFRTFTNSGNALSVQNSAGGSLLNIDSSNSNISLLGNGSGEVQSWTTNTTLGFSARQGHCTVSANGFMYVIGGVNAGGTVTNTVQYARINANGSLAGGDFGNWKTTTAISVGGTQNRVDHGCAVANGYVYVVGGTNNNTNAGSQLTVYAAKLNIDGTVGTWASAGNNLPVVRHGHAVHAYAGYLYSVGGTNTTGTAQTDINYAKINVDGTIGAWTNAPIGSAMGLYSGSVINNGYLYILSSQGAATNYYLKLNSLTGAPTLTGTTTAALPEQREGGLAAAANGYIYYTGGHNAGSANARTSTYYAKPDASGQITAWSTDSTDPLPDARTWLGRTTVVANGYIYAIGGANSAGTSQTTQYYASLPRVQIGGSLDLVGISSTNGVNGGNLNEPGAGGQLTAGNTRVIGSLEVSDYANFLNSVAIDRDLRVGGYTYFRNATDSATSFKIDNVAGTNIFNVDTTGTGRVGTASTNAASTNSNQFTLKTGNAAGATSNSGDLTLGSGDATGTSGNVVIRAGTGATVGTIKIGSTDSITSNSTIQIANTNNATGTQSVSIGSSANTANVLNLQAGSVGGINIGTVGSTATASTINIASTSGNALQQVTIGGTGNTGNFVTLQGGSNGTTGGIMARADGTAAFRIQSANGGTTIFTADVTNTRITIGTVAAPNLGTANLVVGTAEVTTQIRVGGSSNYLQTDQTTGQLRYFGNARNDISITLAPEFAGAVLTGDGTGPGGNVGTMTSDFCATNITPNVNAAGVCGASMSHNYYSWTANATNDYDIFTKWQVPSDYTNTTVPVIQFNGLRSSNTAGTSVTLTIYRADGSNCGTATSITNTTSWGSPTTYTIGSCAPTPGEVLTFRATLSVGVNGETARIGEIYINYKANF